MVKYLISAGADVDNSNSDMRIIFGDTPLAWAVVNNHPQVAEFLIDIAGCNIDKADIDGNTPLHKAGKQSFLMIQNKNRIKLPTNSQYTSFLSISYCI